MPYFHATWSRHVPSIRKRGLGGAAPDRRNFPVEEGVYLASDPAVAVSMLLDAYLESGDGLAMAPPQAVAAMSVLVIDDARLNPDLLEHDPNVEASGLTFIYRGVIDVSALPELSVDQAIGDIAKEDAARARRRVVSPPRR